MYILCSRRQCLYKKGKLGLRVNPRPAHCVGGAAHTAGHRLCSTHVLGVTSQPAKLEAGRNARVAPPPLLYVDRGGGVNPLTLDPKAYPTVPVRESFKLANSLSLGPSLYTISVQPYMYMDYIYIYIYIYI